MTEPSRPTPAGGQPAATAKADRAAERLEREAATRRALFVSSLAGFAAAFGLVALAGKPMPSANAPQPALASDTRVIAEAPVTNLNGDGIPTIIRVVAPERQVTLPHVRTRATP